MKIFSAETMAELEKVAYQQGSSAQQFMEEAGRGIADAVHAYIQKRLLPPRVLMLCGKGNNAGDAFVAGTYLMKSGFQVVAIQPDPLGHVSPLCQENAKRFLTNGGVILPKFAQGSGASVLLDAIFGTGFHGEPKEPYATLIQQANACGKPILALDIPSGLDGNTGSVEGCAIQASETLFLGLPKLGFFLQDGWNHVGELRRVDFGLPPSIVEEHSADFVLLSDEMMRKLLPPIKRNRHKYQSGYVVGWTGSPTMPGAAILSATAALRGGAGMSKLLYPSGMEAELSGAPFELIKVPYGQDGGGIEELMQKAGATYIGPGLGKSETVKQLIRRIVPRLSNPCVIDADAMGIFIEEPFKLPSGTIFTPHRGEMQHLLKSEQRLSLTLDMTKQCQAFAEDFNITLVLKGAPTFIFQKGHPVLVNPRGTPGMATAGSGDVLTGLIASLLSQGLAPRDAAALGVYLHGMAGECAAARRGTDRGMIASDILDCLSEAYQQV